MELEDYRALRREYDRIHQWMNRRYPRRGICEHCGDQRRTGYASIGHTYTSNRDDWLELCHRCHRIFDGHTHVPPSTRGIPLTPQHRAKIRAALSSPEVQAKMRQPRQKPVSAETRAKQSAARRGRKLTPETRAKIAESKRGLKLSDEAKAKISAANTGRPQSPEHRAKNAAAQKGRQVSQETRTKLSTALKGREFSETHRARISEARAGSPRDERGRWIQA